MNATTPRNANTFLLLGLTALLLYLCYLLFRPFAGPIVFATVVVIVFDPLHVRVRRRVRNPSGAALISTLCAFLLSAVPLALVCVIASHELSDLYHASTAWTANQGGIPAYAVHSLQHLARWISGQFGLPTPDLQAMARRRIEEASALLVRLGASLVTNLFSWVASGAIALVILFFLFRDGKGGLEQALSMLPMSEARATELRSRISASVMANFWGALAVGGTQGTLTAIAFWVLGIDSALLWGLVTALFSLVPMIGSAAVWAPAGVILLLIGHPWKGVILLGWGAGVVSVADNIVRPLIISERVRLHPLGVFLSLLGGLQAFGLIGLFVGPVILAVVSSLLGMWREDLAAASSHDPKEP
jgi:predicted PurR-regulated permease PerM